MGICREWKQIINNKQFQLVLSHVFQDETIERYHIELVRIVLPSNFNCLAEIVATFVCTLFTRMHLMMKRVE